MRDLEHLQLEVRSRASRIHFLEAVKAYQGGAFRAALISTWVTVNFDLVDKIRELALGGHGDAVGVISSLDGALAQTDEKQRRKKLQEFEANLLDKCETELELISRREREVLSRLKEDRNLCAHPAYMDDGEVFSPGPELVRSHMVAAVEAVLGQPPVLGRPAEDRFRAEIVSTSWPSARQDVVTYLQHFMGRQREKSQERIAKWIIKACLMANLGIEDEVAADLAPRRYATAAAALSEIRPRVFAELLRDTLVRIEESSGLKDSDLRVAIGSLGFSSEFWVNFPAGSVPKLLACLERSPAGDLARSGVFAVDIPEIEESAACRDMVARRRSDLGADDLIKAHVDWPTATMAWVAVRWLAEVDEYRPAIDVMRHMAASVKELDDSMIRGVLDACRENDTIMRAFTVGESLAEMYKSRSDWGDLSDLWVAVGEKRREGQIVFESLHVAMGFEELSE